MKGTSRENAEVVASDVPQSGNSRRTPLAPGPESIGLASYLRLIRGNRNFRLLWIAQIVSELGDWFYTLAIYSLLLDLTGKASSVALALVLQLLPQTLITPTAGVVNDRKRRKIVMIAADLARLCIVLSMLAVRSPAMVWLIHCLFWKPLRSHSLSRRGQRVCPTSVLQRTYLWRTRSPQARG